MNRLPVAVIAVAVLLLLMVPASSAAAGDGDDGALPQELYPDADIIVTEDDGSVLVTKRLAEPGPDGQTHTVQRYRQNSDLTLVDWTDVDGSVSIVFDGASVRNLTVLSLDTISDPEAPVDVDFTMVSGSAASITGVSAVLRVETALPDSHFTAYSPVSSLTMSIAGDVGVVSASDCLVEIGSIDISVKKGASIDRLYPSGEDGRCTDLSVTIAGGDVGYMSNQRCVVTYLDYDLKAGSVRYLCIGADVQDSDARYLGDLWTFYVQRDVAVSIGAEMDVGTAIVGGGILEAPTMLSNGESPALAQPRNVVLDAHDVTIRANPCFIASDTEVYDLSDYKIGGSVKRAELRDTVGVSSNRIAVYGEDGVWASHSDLTVPAGTVLYLDTDLWVTSGSILSVEPAGTMVNGWFLILSGDVNVSGTFENNGVIERREGGKVHGDTIGEGIVATCIFPRLTDGKIDAFVAGVGTGGTITGIGRFLKEHNPGIRIIAIEPDTSAVLSGKPAGAHKLQGIGAGFVPAVLDRSVIDEVVPVSAEAAGETARKCARTEGILIGISGGAALSVALEMSRKPEWRGKTIVVLLPDSGERYLSTWLFDTL